MQNRVLDAVLTLNTEKYNFMPHYQSDKIRDNQKWMTILPSCLLSKPGVSVTCNEFVSVNRKTKGKSHGTFCISRNMANLEMTVVESNMTH